MIIESNIILHGGSVVEFTLLEYLLRVVLSLFAFGGIAAFVVGGLKIASAIRSRTVENRRQGERGI
ncbi:hypothetical protein [Natronosalvus caseinilyticus]|uniref:hypothetical protein n=1 Tax=Natronosalvus caseinilyticus TaxID=2953747 RepID=UPI0028A72A5A|nr:hypothetical protein [Natronosalvus caseinilyticus]